MNTLPDILTPATTVGTESIYNKTQYQTSAIVSNTNSSAVTVSLTYNDRLRTDTLRSMATTMPVILTVESGSSPKSRMPTDKVDYLEGRTDDQTTKYVQLSSDKKSTNAMSDTTVTYASNTIITTEPPKFTSYNRSLPGRQVLSDISDSSDETSEEGNQWSSSHSTKTGETTTEVLKDTNTYASIQTETRKEKQIIHGETTISSKTDTRQKEPSSDMWHYAKHSTSASTTRRNIPNYCKTPFISYLFSHLFTLIYISSILHKKHRSSK